MLQFHLKRKCTIILIWMWCMVWYIYHIMWHCSELYSRVVLDNYLSRALSVRLNKYGRLGLIDDSGYVLTLDYAIKMLNIHERYKCGVPVIIEGETGVGKTFLLEMLSKLWNQSHLLKWNTQRKNLLEDFQKKLLVDTKSKDYQVCVFVWTGFVVYS